MRLHHDFSTRTCASDVGFGNIHTLLQVGQGGEPIKVSQATDAVRLSEMP